MGLGYVVIYIISKRSGAAGVGFYQLIQQILTVLGSVLGLGMSISVLRYVGQFNNQENRAKMHLLYKYFVCAVTPATILVGIVLFLSADKIAFWSNKGEDFVFGIQIIAITLPFFTINQISVEFVRGLKKLQVSEFVRSVSKPLIVIIGILIICKKNVTSIELVYLIASGIIFNSLISRLSIWNELKKIPKEKINFPFKEFIGTSFSMMITVISSSLITALPVFFLDYYSNQSNVGIYSVSLKFASLISLILVVMNTMAAPKFAELFWAKKNDELQKLLTQSAKIMFWVSLLMSIFLILSGKWLLNLFGEEFISGYMALVILTISQFVNAATGAVSLFLNMSGNQKIVRNTNLTAIIILIIALFLMSKNINITNIALLTAIVAASSNLYLTISLKIKLNIATFYLPFYKGG
jgi:O-antigen/teichoic acid export membrane protein